MICGWSGPYRTSTRRCARVLLCLPFLMALPTPGGEPRGARRGPAATAVLSRTIAARDPTITRQGAAGSRPAEFAALERPQNPPVPKNPGPTRMEWVMEDGRKWYRTVDASV